MTITIFIILIIFIVLIISKMLVSSSGYHKPEAQGVLHVSSEELP